ncbi:hypothetical protein RUM43_000049 [Polyplax serrata]|uniref:Uncharacterized protein n=1 Tax=Polyplax serrata TaxID=468196 RepID=A0AAN8SFA8_POLSC
MMTKVDRVGTKPSVSAITIIGIIAGGLFLQSRAAKLALAGNKSKRSLLTYPPESVFQVTLGVSVEGDFERNVAGFGLALQHNSHLPGDGQIILPELVSSRTSSVYDQLSTIFQRYGMHSFCHVISEFRSFYTLQTCVQITSNFLSNFSCLATAYTLQFIKVKYDPFVFQTIAASGDNK